LTTSNSASSLIQLCLEMPFHLILSLLLLWISSNHWSKPTTTKHSTVSILYILCKCVTTFSLQIVKLHGLFKPIHSHHGEELYSVDVDVCPFLYFAIALSVLQLTDYPFVIIKHFFSRRNSLGFNLYLNKKILWCIY
jgi:hypothetical protein